MIRLAFLNEILGFVRANRMQTKKSRQADPWRRRDKRESGWDNARARTLDRWTPAPRNRFKPVPAFGVPVLADGILIWTLKEMLHWLANEKAVADAPQRRLYSLAHYDHRTWSRLYCTRTVNLRLLTLSRLAEKPPDAALPHRSVRRFLVKIPRVARGRTRRKQVRRRTLKKN
jgi:hypothetical protein